MIGYRPSTYGEYTGQGYAPDRRFLKEKKISKSFLEEDIYSIKIPFTKVC